MKTLLFLLLLIFVTFSLQAQYTIEFSHWKYSNGLNSKQKKSSSRFEKYNADNLLVEQVSNFYNDSIYDRTVYVYNNQKQKIREEEYTHTHILIRKRNYEYNDSGLLDLVYWKGRNKEGDSLTWRQQYFYDAAGQLARMIETSGEYFPSLTHRYEYENKADGKIVTEFISWKENKKGKRIITTYNNKGLVIKIAHKGFDYEADFIYDYEYDGEGNWVTKKVCERQSRISPWIWTGEYRKEKVQYP